MHSKCIIFSKSFKTRNVVDDRIEREEMAPFMYFYCISNGPNLCMKETWVAAREIPAPFVAIFYEEYN